MAHKLRRPLNNQTHAEKLGYAPDLIQPISLKDGRRPRQAQQKAGIYGKIIDDDAAWSRYEKLRKFNLILDHYGVDYRDKKDAFKLAFNLAEDWVPGLSVVTENPRGRGAPRKDSASNHDNLVTSIDIILKSKEARTLIAACTLFKERKKRHEWCKSISPRGIANLYRDTKKVRDAAKKREMTTTLKKAMEAIVGLGHGLTGKRAHKKS